MQYYRGGKSCRREVTAVRRIHRIHHIPARGRIPAHLEVAHLEAAHPAVVHHSLHRDQGAADHRLLRRDQEAAGHLLRLPDPAAADRLTLLRLPDPVATDRRMQAEAPGLHRTVLLLILAGRSLIRPVRVGSRALTACLLHHQRGRLTAWFTASRRT